MKKLLIIIILGAITISCNELDILKVEYRSTTMMGKTTVTITADSVITTFGGRTEPTRTSRRTESSEWTGILKSLGNVDLSKIATLDAPTNKRATDAAPYGSFTISTKDSSYTSASFDGKNPHEMLMPLMNEVVKIWEKK